MEHGSSRLHRVGNGLLYSREMAVALCADTYFYRLWMVPNWAGSFDRYPAAGVAKLAMRVTRRTRIFFCKGRFLQRSKRQSTAALQHLEASMGSATFHQRLECGCA